MKRILLLVVMSISLLSLQAVNPKVDQYVSMLRSKLTQYADLLQYRYKCLGVKTSEDMLIPIVVEYGDNEYAIAEVADVQIEDEEHFYVFPHDRSYYNSICLAFLCQYPSLTQETVTSDAGRDTLFLVLTTQQVNDDRKDQLLQNVASLEQMTKVMCKNELARVKNEAAYALARDGGAIIMEANRELDNVYEEGLRLILNYTQDIHQDINQANNLYHRRQDSGQTSGSPLQSGTAKGYSRNIYGEWETDLLIITDGQEFSNPVDVNVTRLSFRCNLRVEDGIRPFALPFSIETDSIDGTFYVIDRYEADSNVMYLAPYQGLIEAGKGYYFQPNTDITKIRKVNALVIANTEPEQHIFPGLYGTVSPVTVSQGSYLYQTEADGTASFVQVAGETEIDAYRSYLWLGEWLDVPQIAIRFSSDTITDLSSVSAPAASHRLYNLLGQPIDATHRCDIVINNGKTALVR